MSSLKIGKDITYYTKRARPAPEDAFDKSMMDWEFWWSDWWSDMTDELENFSQKHGAWNNNK